MEPMPFSSCCDILCSEKETQWLVRALFAPSLRRCQDFFLYTWARPTLLLKMPVHSSISHLAIHPLIHAADKSLLNTYCMSDAVWEPGGVLATKSPLLSCNLYPVSQRLILQWGRGGRECLDFLAPGHTYRSPSASFSFFCPTYFYLILKALGKY